MKRTFRFITATLSLLLLLSAALPMAVSAEETAPKIVLTEVCYNPTFRENDKGLQTTADILEYVELVNISGETVSLEGITLQHSTDGYDGTFKTNSVLALDGNPLTIAPGEIAVIAIYNADTAKAGLAYATAAERKAYYDFFVDFYACAERLDANHFYIAPAVESGTGKKIEGAFHLTNGNENAVVRLCDQDKNLLCEAGYNAVTWNRNGCAMNLFYRPGIVADHPKASKDFNVGRCTPGMLRDNQVTDAGLVPTGETVPLRVMGYNVCAENTTQTYPDGTQPNMGQRMKMVFEVIESYQPDVFGLTEINYSWLNYVDNHLTQKGEKYGAYGRSGQGSTYGSGQYTGQKWDLFSLVLWRTDKYDLVDQGSFWGSRNPDRPNSCNWPGVTGDMGRASNWVILRDKATGVEFFFLCAHLDAHVEEVRTLSAELNRKKAIELAGGRPIIMVGDWNSSENKPAYDNLTCDGIADARYRTVDYEDMTLYSSYNKWGQFTDQYTTRLPIDHCFISTDNVFVDSAQGDQAFIDDAKTMYASDHNATIFNLQLLIPQAEEPETEPSTEAPTSPVTEAPAETPTEAPTETPTEAPTEAPVAETEAQQSGCGSVILPVAALLLPLAAMALRKRRED